MNLLTTFQTAYNRDAGLTHEQRLQAGIDAVMAESGKAGISLDLNGPDLSVAGLSKQPAEPWAKEKEAFRAGKRIQFRESGEGGWTGWYYVSTPEWLTFDSIEYRIAPDDQPTEAPKAEEWIPKFAVGQMVWIPKEHRSTHVVAIAGYGEGMMYTLTDWGNAHKRYHESELEPIQQPKAEGKTEARSAGEAASNVWNPKAWHSEDITPTWRPLWEDVAQAAIAWEKRHRPTNKGAKIDWVTCPVCGTPDNRKETWDEHGETLSLIYCTNHACLSNGGAYMQRPEPRRITPDNSAC